MAKKLVFGIGVNDADYTIKFKRPDGSWWHCPFHAKWEDMLKRCYSDKYQIKYPNYKSCTVCEEWLTFSNFKSWMQEQDWRDKHLDKDILIQGNKLYCPKTCVFVDGAVNMLLLDRSNDRGECPLGVSWHSIGKKFVVQVRANGKRLYLGLFHTPEEAHKVWQNAKASEIKRVANLQANEAVKNALLLRAEQLLNDLARGVETVGL